jgi:hypothetical protein
MRRTLLMAGFALNCLVTGPARADEPSTKPNASEPEVELCMETRVNGVTDGSYECLNAQLRATMRRSVKARQINAMTGLTVLSAPTSLGLVTVAGEQLRLGPNFGKAAAPFRPTAPAFRAPLGPK